MKTMMIATAFALSLAGAAPAAAQDLEPQNKADMQCFAALSWLGGQVAEDSPEMAGLTGGMMYYLGRLEGRSPNTDWLRQLGIYLDSVTEAELGSDLERCGNELSVKGAALVAWGDSLGGE
ncbi:hypothetical protein [Brevundimonas sp.]|uniref:hypothetical protein n=1 Tax=Brevundimonas sp. TaxID=1871086 RepID=UPI002D4B379F|nr:hypothetical protein [Brevundimonas sp.]HYC67025.1 hypothetical protein [Brevundimonas sp.]